MPSPMPVVRWNWSSKAAVFGGADAFVVSIPKSGRTWLRVLILAYACRRSGREVALGEDVLRGLGAPDVRFTHDRWEHRTARRLGERLRGKYLIPPAARHDRPVVLLARDPRDVLVSLYHQLTRREGRFRGTLGELVRHPRFGAAAVVAVMNGWIAEWGDDPRCLLARYEDGRADPAPWLARILAHCGFAGIDEPTVREAVAFADFDNMRAMEREGRFADAILRPADPDDENSYKVRRGRVGGYRDELPAADLAVVEAALERLDTRFGYGCAPVGRVAPVAGDR